MRPPDTNSFEPSHTLTAATFHDAASATLETALARATDAYVGVDHDELETELSDTQRCRTTWNDVRDSFSWVDDRCPGAWYHASLPEATDELRELWLLEDGHSGAFFVHTVVLTIEDEWLFFAVPHHSLCWLNAPDGPFVDAVEAALAGRHACVLPSTRDVEWSVGERAYRLTGMNLCVHGDGLRRRGCYRLTKLHGFEANPAVLAFSLDWQRRVPSSALRRVLSGISSVVSIPPRRVYVGDEVKMREIETAIRSRLDAYYG